MSKIPLDLSKFRKISSDGNTTTFQHHYGHEIKIAHNKLSSKMKEKLDKLPMAKGGKVQRFEDGGMALPYGGQDPQVAAEQNPGPPATTGYNPGNPETNSVDVGASDQAPPENQAPEDSSGYGAPVQAPQVQQAAAPASAQPKTAGQIIAQPASADDALAHLNDQTAKLRQDFNNGLVSRKKYSDLFEDKNTLGKIGMIFGLLVSGAGSGLAHQQNMALQMMDKEIDQDLDAQKQTKTNQYNALNLAESHYRDEMAAHLTQQQASQGEANTALAKANLPLFKANAAKTSMELAVEQEQLRKANMLPENTVAGQRSRAAAGVLSNAITAQQAQRNQKLAQQIQANGHQAQIGYGQNNGIQPDASGNILSPDATPEKVQGLTSDFNPALSSAQKMAISEQYKQVRGAEAAISQIRKLAPELRKNATITDIYGKSLSTLPFVGNGATQFLDNMTGGNQQRQYKTGKDAFTGYATNALIQLGMTPTDAASAAENFIPAYGDDDETYNGKIDKLVDKIRSTAIAKSPALDGVGLLKKKK